MKLNSTVDVGLIKLRYQQRSLNLLDTHKGARDSFPLRHNIYSTIYRLIFLYISDWSSVFLYLSCFHLCTFFLFTRFKISLSLHLYNINSTVLSHGPAASLEASRWDLSFIICISYTNFDVFEPQSSKGLKHAPIVQVLAFSLWGQSDDEWMVLFILPTMREVLSPCSTTTGCMYRNHWMGETLLRTCTFLKKKKKTA